MLREMKVVDVPQVVKIHQDALPNDFLPSLGEEFLAVLYQANLGTKDAWVTVYRDEGKVWGFVMGTVNFKNFFLSTLISNWLKFSFIIAKQLIRKPSLLSKVLQTFLYSRKEKSDINAELVVIAVDNSNQGRGIGTKLIQALESKFKKLGIKQYKVTTLKSYEGANRFYHKLGFKLIFSFSLYQRRWNLYTKEI